MRVIHLYMLIAVLVGLLVLVAQSMSTDAQTNTNVSGPQVDTPTNTPIARSSNWLTVVPNKTTLKTGETLNLQFTITNAISTSVSIAGNAYTPSDTNFTYNQNQCWALTNNGNTQFPKVSGKYRILAGYVGWDAANANAATNCPVGSTIDHPWRWSIGNTPLAPGASRVINGSIVMTQPGTYTFVFGIVQDFVGYPYFATCNPNGDANTNVCGVQTTTITVLDPTQTASLTRTNSRTVTNSRTATTTRTTTSTRTLSNTRTPSPTPTMSEVARTVLIARYRFDDALGINVNLASAADPKFRLSCGGTTLAPSIRCPEIVAGGINGNALRFNGAHTTRAASPLSLQRRGTFSFWAKPNSTGAEMNVFAISNNLATVVTGFDSSGRFFCSFGASRLTANVSFNTSEWTHFVCTYDEALKQRMLFINSNLVASDTIVAAPRGILMSGVFGSNVAQNNNYYSGDIDEFSLYNAFFTISQVEELYNYFVYTDPARISPTRTITYTPTHTNTPFPTDFMRTTLPSARYTFNENAGATSFANLLATTKPAVCPAPLTCPVAGAAGVRFSNAVSFTGSEALKVSKLLGSTATSPIAVGAWINPSAITGEMVVVSAKSLTQSNKLLFGVTAAGELFCRFGNDSVTSTATVPIGDWTHILCAVSSSKKVVVYLNGAPVANGTWTTMPAGASNIDVWMGMDGTSSSAYYTGLLDEVSFYKLGLTWEMVEVLYDQYTDVSRRSPTRTRTLTSTLTPSRTLSPSRTRTPSITPSITLTPSPETQGSYPYPMPIGTATKTFTSTRTNTLTRTLTPVATATAPAKPYPYPTP